ncbi:hypothetical protein MKX03_013931 [Papaver bracteatum]|nr:hypothetical protein MKX03_013931 [Papaver bracteatum]
MASTSNRHVEGTSGRIKTASSNIFNDNQALVGEIRKVSTMIKGVAVNLEKENRSQMVKELEDAVIELLKTSNDCAHFSSAVQTVGNSYQPGEGLTDFKKLFDEEETKTKAANPLNLQNNSSLRQFREAIWNVHHAGQPMPGDEQEDIVMTSTQTSILNITCPVSGKPITELQDPVRSMDCRHIYEMKVVLHYIKKERPPCKCPVAGCPKILQAERVVCDPLLLLDIDEYRSTNIQTARPNMVQDFTELEEDE